MPSLSVPEDLVPAFAQLHGLSDSEYSAVHDVLSTAEPNQDFVAIASEKSELKESVVRALVRAISSLVGISTIFELTTDEAADQVASSPDLKVPEEEQQQLSARIKSLASCRCIRLREKIATLGREHQRVFLDARIMTDVRPIFGDEVESELEGVLVSHTLKLEYLDEEKNVGAFHIVLDNQDIGTVEKCIARAKDKNERVASILDNVGLSDFSPGQ